MLMNRMESALVDSAPRRALQRVYETRVLIRLGGRTPGASVAEIGCGSGYGTKLIIDQFGAKTVDAVDLDPRMISRAWRRLRRYRQCVRLECGSVTHLRDSFSSFGGGTNASYDAVFDFGIIHHIPGWQGAIAEVARVLKPGGRFYFDEVTATALARPSYQLLFDHPTENRFTAGQFLAELDRHDLAVEDRWVTRMGSDYLIGVAIRR